MIAFRRPIAILLAGATLQLAACAPVKEAPRTAAPPPVEAAPAPAPAAAAAGPALWKVADEDTTIYLFGTVHALPASVEWYTGPVAQALAAAQVLVTEIPSGELTTPAVQQAFIARAQLPEGQSLRAILPAERRAAYDAALAKFGLPAAAFDRFEPWFVAITLSTLPLLKAGYSMEAGVESAIEGKAGTEKKRAALETVESQLRLFDELPMDTQIAYLGAVIEQLDQTVPTMNAMVAAWAKGDADALAELLNRELDDPALAERLLYARNRNWAEWIRKRLEEPGTAFMAVGAGHLAGKNSVQDYVTKAGTAVVRVQ